MVQAITALLALLAVSPSLAHPGQSIDHINHEIAARAAYLKNAPRDLDHCAAKMEERGIAQRALDRRATTIQNMRNEVALKKTNGTLTGGNIAHTGQLFFDQDLIDRINADVAPYNTNQIGIVDNADDRVFAGEAISGSDPVFNYVLPGDDVEDGLYAWITIGIDPAARYTANPAAIYGSGGGYVS